MEWGPVEALQDAQVAGRVLRLRTNAPHSGVVNELCRVYHLERHVGSALYRPHRLVASGDLASGLRLFLCGWTADMYSLILTRMDCVDPVVATAEWVGVRHRVATLRTVVTLDEDTARARAKSTGMLSRLQATRSPT